MALTMTRRQVWEERWTQPEVAQLLQALGPPEENPLARITDELADIDGLCRTLAWYDQAWKWTIEYTDGKPLENPWDAVCYLVPNPADVAVCVPLSKHVIEQLPMRKISKYIREGIISAKCAVRVHWAIWKPNNVADAPLIADLIRRKYDVLTGKTKKRPRSRAKK